jgi:hypothetical protein
MGQKSMIVKSKSAKLIVSRGVFVDNTTTVSSIMHCYGF